MACVVFFCIVEINWSGNYPEFILQNLPNPMEWGQRHVCQELRVILKPLTHQPGGSPYGQPPRPDLHPPLLSFCLLRGICSGFDFILLGLKMALPGYVPPPSFPGYPLHHLERKAFLQFEK